MSLNVDKDKWYENRILWRARQHDLLNKRCSKFDDLSDTDKKIVMEKINEEAKPVLVFMKESEVWTTLTTKKVISYHSECLHVADLDAIEKDIQLLGEAGASPRQIKRNANFIRLNKCNVTIWVPNGAEALAMLNILRMFPLLQ